MSLLNLRKDLPIQIGILVAVSEYRTVGTSPAIVMAVKQHVTLNVM
jgi:hypothetical protein